MDANPRATQALLDLVLQDRDRRCAAYAAQGGQEARDALATARGLARTRVHQALEEERRRLHRHVLAADAELATARRRHETRLMAAMLERGLAALAEALNERWSTPDARRQWAGHVFAMARAALGEGPWLVEHARGWPADERAAALQPLGVVAGFTEDPAIRAGLRVRAGGNVVDGTLEGLLADRDAVGARLLDATPAPTLPQGGGSRP